MDNSIINRAKNGDKDAFAKLYIQYKDKLYRYAYFKLGNSDDAMDAVSNCITSAYLSIGTLKNEKAFSSWLFRILYRECCALLRQKSIERNNVDYQSLNIEAQDNTVISAELKEALDSLYYEEKDIVLLSVIGGYNSKEIAEILYLKPGTVRSKLSRALAKMRSFLE